MSIELSYLAMFGVFTIALILVQVLISLGQHGLAALAGNREGLVSTGMAARAENAVANTLAAMALFAPAVILVAMTNSASASTALAVQVFLTARIAYAIIYIIGAPWLRTLTWIVAFLCILYLYISAL